MKIDKIYEKLIRSHKKVKLAKNLIKNSKISLKTTNLINFHKKLKNHKNSQLISNLSLKKF